MDNGHDIIVIGASAGGVEALTRLAGSLPAGIPAALFVVLHIPAQSPSILPAILSRSGPLPALHPADRTPIRNGHIYVAPSDHHLLIEDRHVRVIRGPRENRHRPAIDPLFRSAAGEHGARVVGVILTGTLDDGTAGLLAIKRCGGTTVVQDPEEAPYPGMPRSALASVPVDHCVPLSAMGQLLAQLAGDPVEESGHPSADMIKEVRAMDMDVEFLSEDRRPGKPSPYSCPECGGVLWEMKDGELLRFRCRVGHAFSAASVLAEQSEAVERALWVALKTLEEKLSLARRLALEARQKGHTHLAARFDGRAADAEERAETIRRVLLRDGPGPEEADAAELPGPAQEGQGQARA